MENLLNLLFPARCLFCGDYGRTFCAECLSKCRPMKEDFCIVCGKTSERGYTHPNCLSAPTPTELFCCFEYEGLVRLCIKKSKYSGRQFSALKTLAVAGALYAKNLGKDYSDFAAVPIPLNSMRFKKRGFNQAELIADILCRVFKIKKDISILTRKKNTAAQHANNRKERFTNIEGAFGLGSGVGPGVLRGRKLLLVDDISTSGSTLRECAKILKKSGAEKVLGITLAHEG